MVLTQPVGVALQNVRLYASEKDRRVLNESLLEVSRAILGTPTEENALGTVLDQMWRVVRYQAAAAVILEGDELRVAASRGGSTDIRVPLGSSGELGLVLERHATHILIVSDARACWSGTPFRCCPTRRRCCPSWAFAARPARRWPPP